MPYAFHILVPLLLCLVGSAAHAGNMPDQLRQDELRYLLHQDCGSCHGMTLKGGLGPSLLPDALRGKPAEYLHRVISKGVPEKAMPGWNTILSPQDIDFLVHLLTGATNQVEQVR